MSSVKTRTEGPILEVTLDRPKANAIDLLTSREMGDVFAKFRDNPELRVAILTGGGEKFFCPGWDLKAAADGDAVDGDYGVGGFGGLQELRDMNKPVIAAVHGHCYTGALEVALAADFILAAESARFGDTHAKWALTPIWGMSQRLPRRVGVATAKRLMFTADMIRADEAFRIGLVEQIVPDADFDTACEDLARRILANSPFSHAANKRLLEATDARDMDSGLQWEILNCEGVGPDMQDRIAAFTGKSKKAKT